MGRNTRIRSRTKLELPVEGRRLGGYASLAAVFAAAVFALGLAVGRRGDAPPAAPELPADRLALLDGAERLAPPAPKQVEYSFPGALIDAKDKLPQVPARAAPKGPKVVARVAPPALAPHPDPLPAPRGEGASTRTPTSTPTSTSTSTPTPTAAPWSIQLGASPKEPEAKRLAARHAGARVVPADVDGKRWYRVRLGSYATRSEAQADLARVAAPGAFVAR